MCICEDPIIAETNGLKTGYMFEVKSYPDFRKMFP